MTPESWRMESPDLARRNPAEGLAIYDEAAPWGERLVAVVHGLDFETLHRRAEQIAALPDLLEALIRLADRFAFDGVPEDGENEYDEARAAIAKARGSDA